MSCPRCNAPAADETLREFGGVCPKCLLDFSEEQDAPSFPNLEIVEMLGQGGMGVVYKAVQKNLGRTVALKVLSPQLSADPDFVERFTREARALASLSHPNIVGIYDSGIHDHVPYLVMEYVDGTPLRKMLASKKLSPEQVLEVIPQICDALHYAHAHGVVHRDIKPENILLDRQGRVKIADFGLAKLASQDETRITKTGFVMGSPHYMAPEQFAHSGRVDHRADIYSLGVVFYEMLTGEVPMGRFKAPSEKAPVDQRLDPVVLKSLEREPEDRWQSVDEVKARVSRLDAVMPPAAPESRKKKILLAAIGAMFVLGIGTALWFDKTPDPRTPEDDVKIAIGGPVLVIGGMVVTLVLLIGPLRGRRFRRIEPLTPARRQAMMVGIAAGGVALIAVVILMVGVRAQAPPLRKVSPPSAEAVNPAPSRFSGARWHVLKEPFRVDDVWPTGTELPEDFHDAKTLDADQILQKSEYPSTLLPDLEYARGLEFRDGRALIVGLQFRNDFARRRWEKELGWKESRNDWQYHLYGESLGVIFIRHDGSAIGEAAKETLEAAVERNVSRLTPEAGSKKEK